MLIERQRISLCLPDAVHFALQKLRLKCTLVCAVVDYPYQPQCWRPIQVDYAFVSATELDLGTDTGD